MDKKGYFFTLDSMLSLGILILGSFLIFSSYIFVPSNIQTNILAKAYNDEVRDEERRRRVAKYKRRR